MFDFNFGSSAVHGLPDNLIKSSIFSDTNAAYNLFFSFFIFIFPFDRLFTLIGILDNTVIDSIFFVLVEEDMLLFERRRQKKLFGLE